MNFVTTTGAWADNIRDVHGETGRTWLNRLPTTLAACADKWALKLLPPFPALTYNYVTPAVMADGTPVVLKAGVPGVEFFREAEALRAFAGRGCVRLLGADMASGVLMLERLLPGTCLADLDDDVEITSRAIAAMQRLHTPAPQDHAFVSVRDWAHRSFDRVQRLSGGNYGPLSRDLVDLARSLFTTLTDSGSERLLIHGDFHPQNILSSGPDSWLAIDPKGVVGDPLYDIAVLVCQTPPQIAELELKQLLIRRIDQVAGELAVDRSLVSRWCLAHSVLSGVWSFEDHGDRWGPAFARAKVLRSLS